MIFIRLLFCVIIIFNLTGCSGCLESKFELSADSRLPKWFTVPDGMKRKDFSVKMNLYITPNGIKDVLKIYQKNKSVCIKKYVFTENDHPGIKVTKGYPKYKVITINGITDVIVFRKMEPYFYMENDPEIWEQVVKAVTGNEIKYSGFR